LAPNICKIVAGTAVSPRFLEIFLRSYRVRRQIIGFTAMTATPSLTMTQIRRILILIPRDKLEQDEIARRIGEISNFINACEGEAQKIRSLKTALMQDLLTGKRRVTSLLEPKS